MLLLLRGCVAASAELLAEGCAEITIFPTAICGSAPRQPPRVS